MTNATTAKTRRLTIRQRRAICTHTTCIELSDCKVCIVCEAVLR
jgi:hypothetical protein